MKQVSGKELARAIQRKGSHHVFVMQGRRERVVGGGCLMAKPSGEAWFRQPISIAFGPAGLHFCLRPRTIVSVSIGIAIIVGLIIGIAGLALWSIFLFRRQALNIALLATGAALLVYGHVLWWAKNESPEIKEAMYIRHIVAGWALAGMGFAGIQFQRSRWKDHDS